MTISFLLLSCIPSKECHHCPRSTLTRDPWCRFALGPPQPESSSSHPRLLKTSITSLFSRVTFADATYFGSNSSIARERKSARRRTWLIRTTSTRISSLTCKCSSSARLSTVHSDILTSRLLATRAKTHSQQPQSPQLSQRSQYLRQQSHSRLFKYLFQNK